MADMSRQAIETKIVAAFLAGMETAANTHDNEHLAMLSKAFQYVCNEFNELHESSELNAAMDRKES
jgi:hypothetical protein